MWTLRTITMISAMVESISSSSKITDLYITKSARTTHQKMRIMGPVLYLPIWVKEKSPTRTIVKKRNTPITVIARPR